MPINVKQARDAKPRDKDWKLPDEKGLHLLIKANGAKYWRFRYRFGTKDKTLALGVFPEIAPAEARILRDEAREKLRKDIDPAQQRQEKKKAAATLSANTFEAITHEWLSKRGKKSKSNDARLMRLLEKDLFPVIGKLAITEVTPPQLLGALEKIEDRGAHTIAKRARGYASNIFNFAIASGKADRNPADSLQGALKTVKATHLAAITEPKKVGELMAAIGAYEGTITVCAALKLSPLLFCRQGELRHLEWSEINWQEERIEIPAEKMKMREPFIIPLSRQALAILKELDLMPKRGIYVFPSVRGASRPLSENGVRTALRTMGFDNETMTPHGFRAMARTLLDEVLGFRVELIEAQLAHAVKDVNGRAYNRTKHLPQRKEMMQKWANYLDNLKAQAKAGNVITGNFGSEKA